MATNRTASVPLDLVGLLEISDLLGVAVVTPRQWRARGLLPEPDAVVSGTPVWLRSTIVSWARETGRDQHLSVSSV